jgi:hypothetical protein
VRGLLGRGILTETGGAARNDVVADVDVLPPQISVSRESATRFRNDYRTLQLKYERLRDKIERLRKCGG